MLEVVVLCGWRARPCKKDNRNILPDRNLSRGNLDRSCGTFAASMGIQVSNSPDAAPPCGLRHLMK